MTTEKLGRFMRSAANRKVNSGVEPRDPVTAGQRFEESRALPRALVAVVVLCGAIILAVVAVELAAIPPAHILIVAFCLAFLVLWLKPKRRMR